MRKFREAVVLLLAMPALGADNLTDIANRARARCEAIPAGEYHSAMIFNPQGLQTLFPRSECFQNLARELREEVLCQQATERQSFIFDGSGISPAVCRKAVQVQQQQDRAAAQAIRNIHVLTEFSITPNGNGRDVDLLFRTSGGLAHTYQLTLVALDAAGGRHVLLDQPQPLGEPDTRLNHFLPRTNLQLTAIRSLGRPVVTMEATLELVPRSLDERAVFQYLPEAQRRHTLGKDIALAAIR